MNSWARIKQTTVLLLGVVLLYSFAFPPLARAVNPPPDGGYGGANTAEGDNALLNLATGIANTAVGFNALAANTTGGWNVAIGSSALASNRTGSFNMAIGTDALTNSTANYNLAIGFRVAFMNTTGNHLTGIGAGALFSNTTGSFNTAIGADALSNNSTGGGNTATGNAALFNNTSGFSNTATGVGALNGNTIGARNTANGIEAMGGSPFVSNTGNDNTAVGYSALLLNESGDRNTAVGQSALIQNATGSDNTAIGTNALGGNVAGSNNIAVGFGAGQQLTTGGNNIDVGAVGVAADSNTIRIGTAGTHTATFIAGISRTAVTGTAVVVDGNGQLGVAASSARFKDEITPMDKASEAILALKPVVFRYKKEIHPAGTQQFGLVAEEVADINSDLVTRDSEGKPFTVRYDAVNAMLLNEFLKEHRKVEKLEATVAQQRKDFEAAVAQLTTQVQKVSAQIEARKPAPQVVNNP